MEDKREHGRSGSGQIDLNTLPSSKEDLYLLLLPLGKLKLVDLLSQLGSQYPFIAEEIISVASADPALRKLFIRGLDWDTTSETLSAAFEVHGEIEETTVIFDKATGKSRGFGFITYKDMESAQSALKAPGKMVDGRMVICHLAADGSTNGTPTAADQISRKIYIGGLSPETTTELLLDFVGKHGEIEEGSIAYDKDLNKPRGFGFVTFKTVEAAKKAIDDPEKILCGRLLTVKPADNRKSKVSPTPVVPLPAVGMSAMYPGTHSINSASMTPVGFTYPPPPPMAAAAYPRTGGYTSQPVGPAAYSGQPRIPYPQFGFNQESPMVSTSTGAYPKYGTKE